jgi:hypothetical protein
MYLTDLESSFFLWRVARALPQIPFIPNYSSNHTVIWKMQLQFLPSLTCLAFSTALVSALKFL